MRYLALCTSTLAGSPRTACMTEVPDAGELPEPVGPSRALVSFYWWTYCAALASAALLAAGLLHVAPRVHAGLLAVPLAIALLLGYAVSRRVWELRAHRDLPGPRPSFFLGNLRSRLSYKLGHHVPAGTNIMWMKTAVGRDAANFHDPERFDPARYVCRAESMAQALPFGAGPRHCIGRGLAELTAPRSSPPSCASSRSCRRPSRT